MVEISPIEKRLESNNTPLTSDAGYEMLGRESDEKRLNLDDPMNIHEVSEPEKPSPKDTKKMSSSKPRASLVEFMAIEDELV